MQRFFRVTTLDGVEFVSVMDSIDQQVIGDVARSVIMMLLIDRESDGERESGAHDGSPDDSWGDGFEAREPLPDGHPLTELAASMEDVVKPQDPAVARLLPDASKTDPVLAAEFRRLTQGDLRLTKLRALEYLEERVRTAQWRVRVPAERAGEFLRGLNDVRLVLAQRLAIATEEDSDEVYRLAVDEDARESEDSPERVQLATIYSVLGWWQESLLEALTESS